MINKYHHHFCFSASSAVGYDDFEWFRCSSASSPCCSRLPAQQGSWLFAIVRQRIGRRSSDSRIIWLFHDFRWHGYMTQLSGDCFAAPPFSCVFPIALLHYRKQTSQLYTAKFSSILRDRDPLEGRPRSPISLRKIKITDRGGLNFEKIRRKFAYAHKKDCRNWFCKNFYLFL